MNRMARIVLDPNRTYAGTRTAVQLCGSQGVISFDIRLFFSFIWISISVLFYFEFDTN